MKAGAFIVLEGGEGSGKSTLAANLGERLRETGAAVHLLREPGGTVAGEQLRRVLHERLIPWAEAFAFLAARAQLVSEVIHPALEGGATVICDRFSASTFAYQGFGRGLDLDTLRIADRAATDGLEPDLTLYLDIEPATGLARKGNEVEGVATGFETIEFHQRVRAGYLKLAAAAPPRRWLTIDAVRAPADVAEVAWQAVRTLLEAER